MTKKLLTILLLVGCAGNDDTQPDVAIDESGAPVVYVSNYPLVYFANRIGSGVVRVEFPMATATDPAFWRPDAEVVIAMQGADLILLNGATYENWFDLVTLPAGNVVNTSEAFADRYLTVASAVTHSHGPEGEHSHEGTAFTTWLDPTLAILHAEAVERALSVRWPNSAAAFRDNLSTLRVDLERLDRDLRDATVALRDVPLLASHPIYQYFAAHYGLDLEAVTWEPDEMPSERQWRALRDLLRRHPAKLMLWEADPSAKIAARLVDMGVEPLVFAQHGNRPEDGDYLDAMNANVERLAAAQ